jgi:hypothetical protein
VRSILKSKDALLLRTDFLNEDAWAEVSAAVQQPVGEFRAYVTPVSDPAFDGATVDDVARLVSEAGHPFDLRCGSSGAE